jgi:hypothetical protein
MTSMLWIFRRPPGHAMVGSLCVAAAFWMMFAGGWQRQASAGTLEFTIEVDLTGWETYGGFANQLNTRELIPLSNPGSEPLQIVAARWENVSFTSVGASWRSEVFLSLNTSTESSFWDQQLAPGLGSPGDYTGSGVFGEVGSTIGSPFELLPDNQLLVYVYESFDDAGPTGLDAVFTGGTLFVTYTAVPEPSSLALLGALAAAGAGLTWQRRRRQLNQVG